MHNILLEQGFSFWGRMGQIPENHSWKFLKGLNEVWVGKLKR
jgi:hypothetical protein